MMYKVFKNNLNEGSAKDAIIVGYILDQFLKDLVPSQANGVQIR